MPPTKDEAPAAQDAARAAAPGGASAAAPDLADRLAELTLELCRIPSVTGDEAALADDLERRCRALPRVSVERVGHAVLAQGPRRPGRPTIALLGHSDTVRPAADQELELRGGRVFGCGASDMKGGLAVMLLLLGEAADLPAANLRCVFYDKEEGPAEESGLEPLLQAGRLRDVDLGVCLEPTDNVIQAGCVGGLHARVTFRGRRAHSARPWQGESAISAALPFLGRLAALPRLAVTIAGLTYYEVMTATTAETHNSRNVVPDRFVLNVNYRFAPGKSIEEAEAELRALVALDPAGADAAVEIVDRAPSGPICLDQPQLAAWRAALGLPVEPKQAWTDVARLGQHGVPAVNFGPGETAQAHQAHESVPVAYLVSGYHALRRLFA